MCADVRGNYSGTASLKEKIRRLLLTDSAGKFKKRVDEFPATKYDNRQIRTATR